MTEEMNVKLHDLRWNDMIYVLWSSIGSDYSSNLKESCFDLNSV